MHKVAIALVGIFALSLSLSRTAFAEDGPSAEDLKNSKTRGIFLKVPGSPAAFEMRKDAATVKPDAKAKSKTSTQPKSKNAATVIKAVRKTEIKKVTENVTPKKPAALKKSAHKSAGLSVLNTHGEQVQGQDQGESIIKAWLNKSGKHPNYKDGEKMQVSVKASKDCNLVIYDFDGKGTLTQIFPNDYQKEASLRAGDTVTIGGDNSSFDFQVSVAEGTTQQQERLFVFAYPAREEAPVSVAMTKLPDSPFRSANMSMEQYRKLVNQSKVYYSRSVKVVPKNHKSGEFQQIANQNSDGESAPNKTELSFSVEK